MEKIMNYHVFSNQEEDGASNMSCTTTKVCVGGKVHVTISDGSFEQTGCEKHAHDFVSIGGLVPCNGSCRRPYDSLSDEVEREMEKLVRTFLSSNGKERGEYERKWPRR
jgi:hypothetical protein